MVARVSLHGTALLADARGALFWPLERTLMLADLHLEKGSSFARRGMFLPPYDTRATLDRLAGLLRLYRPDRVCCLGDSFHDREASARLDDLDRDRLRRMVQAHAWIWISGNHDPLPPEGLGGQVLEEWRRGPLVLRHEPSPKEAVGELAGHLHPKAAISAAGRRVVGPCFVSDGQRMILPAFGAYAGGLDVLDQAISGLFGRAGFHVWMLGRERLHRFTRAQLMGRRERAVIQSAQADVSKSARSIDPA
jgi:DNA ligase-associated metallophosphoesterase